MIITARLILIQMQLERATGHQTRSLWMVFNGYTTSLVGSLQAIGQLLILITPVMEATINSISGSSLASVVKTTGAMTTIQRVSFKILDMYSSPLTATPPIHAEFTSVLTTVEDQELLKTMTVSFNMPPQTISSSSTQRHNAGTQVKTYPRQTQKCTSKILVSTPNSSRTSCVAFSTLLTTAVKQELMSARAPQLSHLLPLLFQPPFGQSSDVTKLFQFNQSHKLSQND